MIRPIQSESHQDDWRRPSEPSPLTVTGGDRGQFSSMATSQAIAEDPDLVCLAGRLISQAAAGSHVRFEKIDALRCIIETSAYRIFFADLAEKLMESMTS